MQRALMCHQAVRRKLKKGVEMILFFVFTPFLSLHQFILLTQGPIPEIFEKNIENWRSWKMKFCFVFCYFVFKKKYIFVFLNKNYHGFHMSWCLFLHYGWFLQNLEKGCTRTNMHTTVYY